jgi:hypothetical protein
VEFHEDLEIHILRSRRVGQSQDLQPPNISQGPTYPPESQAHELAHYINRKPQPILLISSILPAIFKDNPRSTRMFIEKVCDIVYFPLDNHPA